MFLSIVILCRFVYYNVGVKFLIVMIILAVLIINNNINNDTENGNSSAGGGLGDNSAGDCSGGDDSGGGGGVGSVVFVIFAARDRQLFTVGAGGLTESVGGRGFGLAVGGGELDIKARNFAQHFFGLGLFLE
jgi:hypothetical protein